jgi:hypothetical protein
VSYQLIGVLHFVSCYVCQRRIWSEFSQSCVIDLEINTASPRLTSSCDICSSLYVLGINSLSDIQFTNIFSDFTDCLFSLMIVSFIVQKLFSFM